MNKIKTLIVDDEPLARERVRTLLEGEPDFAIVGEAATGRAALNIIDEKTVDLLFLDIQMPELDGIRLIEKIPFPKIPLIVFTTAFDTFAVKAFELNAVDYLLKPFTKKRFQQTLQKIQDQTRSEDRDLYSASMLSALQSIIQQKQYPERLVVKSEGKIQFIPVKNINWAESDANYINLHTDSDKFVLRDTMANLSQRLDPKYFLRTHRSVLVNIHSIKEVKPWLNDELVIVLHNGTQLPVGRTFRKNVLQSLHP